ncbi:solute carrier family 23 member 2 isoform X1 [Bombyx mori]|uniref:Solute carrier family 23 member 2 n=1 Tax=Bombyx mori TaxID=7091 RepID=A0A8R2AL04_BOMMO|nr:solute carrier family 23 member 2 isoform X2 [Bombyx mori]XP_037872832.1 solute carrier family 23 member 2 isoform X2 [Bombyx mori]
MVNNNVIQIGLDAVRGVCVNDVRGEQKPEEARKGNVTYGIDDTPPWYLCIFMALQHYLTMIGAIVAIPFILCPALCMEETDPDRSNIISTMIFVTGLITWLQATFGCRLPIVQGGTISFLVPTLAILNLPAWKCPEEEILVAMSTEERRQVWTSRMCELSGAIAVAALFQLFLGYFGVIGSLLRFVTPLTIAPTVALVGLTLFDHAAEAASQQWGIAAGTFILLTIFSQCMTNVNIPTLSYNRDSGCTVAWFPLFKLFPVLLTIIIMWAVCGILTVTGVFPPEHPARTDLKVNIIEDAPWFRIPYPGQWGAPTVSVAGVLGMLAGVLACTVESISYYPTTARMCGAPPPPLHAINRGLGTEGLGTALAGLWGSGNGTNTFGENVGAIGVTKVGSRRVVQFAAGLMVLQGVVGKLGAVFIIIPQPVVGGLFCVMFGMISAFGLSALQYVDLNSSRNLYIIGFSLFFPLVLTRWMAAHSGVIHTGLEALDAVLQVLLSTSILVGGAVGCLLDNVIPGTDEERGLAAWAKEMSLEAAGASDDGDTYDFPIGMSLIRRWKWTYYLPFMPTYEKGKFTALFIKKKL